MYLFFH
jgi:hypothetical protein